jgi:putative phosphoribosyl transferase
MDDLNPTPIDRRPVLIETGSVTLEGELALPEGAHGLVIFAHGSGSSRLSPRNRHVAARLNAAGLATLLIDLLTPAEEATDQETGDFRFDIALLA